METDSHDLVNGLSDITGSLGLGDGYSKHVAHLAIISSMSFPIPSQNTTSLALCLHFTMSR